jgi:hypothetical protein
MARCYTTPPPGRDHQHRSDQQFRDDTRKDQFDDHGGRFCNGSASAESLKSARTRAVRSSRRVVCVHTHGERVALPASA